MEVVQRCIYPQEVTELPMFHPTVKSRKEAEMILKSNYKGVGTYFVRANSQDDPTFISITTSLKKEEVFHIRVHLFQENGVYNYYIHPDMKFSSFKGLLAHYYSHRVHSKQGIDNVRLQVPIEFSRPVQLNQKSGAKSIQHLTGTPNIVKSNSTEASGNANAPIQVPTQTSSGNVWETSPQFIESSKRRKNYSIHISNSEVWEGNKIPTEAENRLRSRSESDVNNATRSRVGSLVYYQNKSVIKENSKTNIKCRAPALLPASKTTEDNYDIYYTQVEVNRNFFRETYEYLKNNEECECGLKLVDSELPLNWAVHRSQDPGTVGRIFFQQGDETTWDMPPALLPYLDQRIIVYILDLCREGKTIVPPTLAGFLKNNVFQKNKETHRDTSSVNSHNISSSDSGSSRSSKKKVMFSTDRQHSPLVGKAVHPSDSSSDGNGSFAYEKPDSLLVDSTSKANDEINHSSKRRVSFDSTHCTLVKAELGSPTTNSAVDTDQLKGPSYYEFCPQIPDNEKVIHV